MTLKKKKVSLGLQNLGPSCYSPLFFVPHSSPSGAEQTHSDRDLSEGSFLGENGESSAVFLGGKEPVVLKESLPFSAWD